MANINRLVPRRSAGAWIIDDPEAPVEQNVDTLMCVHCGAHWSPVTGSGRQRGYCMNCRGVTCGKQLCEMRCLPVEALIERIEAEGRMLANLREIARS